MYERIAKSGVKPGPFYKERLSRAKMTGRHGAGRKKYLRLVIVPDMGYYGILTIP
jgi:hypothetical protein